MSTVFFPEPEGRGRCLGNEARLTQLGLDVVETPELADIIAARHMEDFTEPLLAYDRLNVLWTPEPFHTTEELPVVRRAGKLIHVFSVFTTNVLTDNFYFIQEPDTWDHLGVQAPEDRLKPIETEADLNAPYDNKRIIAMMTRRKYELVAGGIEYALSTERATFAIKGAELGRVDLHGKGWPITATVGNTRKDKNWRAIKIEMFGGYNFAFCPENSFPDYYVTEKIWDAIRANCLPIWGGPDTIYEIMPRNSFIDLRVLRKPRRVFDLIDTMPFEEFRRRMNILKDVYRNALATHARMRSHARTTRILDNFLKAQLALRTPVRQPQSVV